MSDEANVSVPSSQSAPASPSDNPMSTTEPELGQSAEARQWGMFCHLAALSGLVGVPMGHILGPLIVWQMKKGEMPFVDDQGKESLNFQITIIIACFVCIPLCFVIIGFILLPIVLLVSLIYTIIGAMKANAGLPYRYPFAIRFLK